MNKPEDGFTLLEVMISLAIVAIALVSLLGLHHQNLQSVIRSQQMTTAALLAQDLMTQAELDRFPAPGATQGDFQSLYPGKFRNFRWERRVEETVTFPDVRKVTIRIVYGQNFGRSFNLVEFMHSPVPVR